MAVINISSINPFVRFAKLMSQTFSYVNVTNLSNWERFADDWRLFIITQNKAEILINSKKYHIGENTLLLIPPKTPYIFFSDNPTLRNGNLIFYCINFDLTQKYAHNSTPRAPRKTISKEDGLEKFDDTLLEEVSAPIISVASPSILNNMLIIATEQMLASPYSALKISALLKFILLEIVEQHKVQPSLKATISAILEYITKNINQPFTIKDMANDLHFHPFYMSKIFKDNINIPLHTFIMQERLVCAKNILTHNDASIEEVSINSGFKNLSHFCKAFKKAFGISPDKYRKQYANKDYSL